MPTAEGDENSEIRRDLVGGFLKGLRVIESFSAERPRQSITQTSQATGFDRATCRRLLLTLLHAGYADQDGRQFWLTPKALRLSHVYLDSASLPNILQPYLEQLSEEIHESCSASVMDDNEVVYIARASHKRVMAVNLRIGSVVPLHCSSMGRVLLAGLPRDVARQRLSRVDRQAYTVHTITDLDELMVHIDRAREDGYAMVDQELEIGLRSIAVPITDARGKVLAAVNIGTPAGRISTQCLTGKYLTKLLEVQQAIVRLL